MINRVKILITFLFLQALMIKSFSGEPMYYYKIPKHEELANEIGDHAAKILSEKYQLWPIGSGGSMMDDIKRLALSFQSFRVLSIEECRKIVVNCVQEYLNDINSNEKIRPYLHEYPFQPKNIEINIFIYNKDHREVAYGQVSSVSAFRGEITYVTPKSQYERETLKEETFEEALKIAKEQGLLEP